MTYGKLLGLVTIVALVLCTAGAALCSLGTERVGTLTQQAPALQSALANYQQRRYAEAVALLEKLELPELDKSSRRAALTTLDSCYGAMGQWEKKAKVTDSLMVLCPEENGVWLFEMAQDLQLQNRCSDAIPLYMQSIPKLSGDNTRLEAAWRRIAQCYAQVGGARITEVFLSELSQQGKPRWWGCAAIDLAEALVDKGTSNQAAYLLQHVSQELESGNWDRDTAWSVFSELSRCNAGMLQWNEDAKLVQVLIAKYSDDDGRWTCHLADDLRMQKRYAEAIPYYREAIPKMPGPSQQSEALRCLAQCYAGVEANKGLGGHVTEVEQKH